MNYPLFSDRAAFEATAGTIGIIFSKFYKPLYYFAFQQLQNKLRAEDAVATAFLECWKNISDDPGLAFTASQIEADLYDYAGQYCRRHLNLFSHDRVLSAIFDKARNQEQAELCMIETKALQQLAGAGE